MNIEISYTAGLADAISSAAKAFEHVSSLHETLLDIYERLEEDSDWDGEAKKTAQNILTGIREYEDKLSPMVEALSAAVKNVDGRVDDHVDVSDLIIQIKGW